MPSGAFRASWRRSGGRCGGLAQIAVLRDSHLSRVLSDVPVSRLGVVWNLTQVLHDNPEDPGDMTAGGLANPSRLREAAGSQRSATGTSGALGGGPRGKHFAFLKGQIMCKFQIFRF